MHDLPTPKPFVYIANKKCPLPLAGIIKIPPKVVEESYKDLICSDVNRMKIYELITTMADNGKISLLFNHQTRLKTLGVELEQVHPLKFLAVIFSNPQLKACMYKVFDDPFKRTEFVDGITPNMMRQLEKGKLLPFIADFAREVGRSDQEMRPYFHTLNWDGLVTYLIGGMGGG